MNDPYNPFAPPKAEIAPAGEVLGQDCWRSGKLLIMRSGSALPPRCVKCNEPAVTPMKWRKVSWHSPLLFLLILIGLLVYVIVALIARKKAMIAPGLCARHTSRRNGYIAFTWIGFLGGIGLCFASGGNGAVVLTGIVLILAALITGTSGTRILYPTRIEGDLVTLKGCGRAFLDTLPGN
jgi:hypothetical protein